ncbi:MAG: hypothetical protein CMM93_04165 [Rickettsiales bacterium]|nr:hypothetical protein [Rickettsiales bacterium]|tara:strand:+ start:1618 stop:2343 length:726 start_codon:yes stop_codon:yes gene_type:complete
MEKYLQKPKHVIVEEYKLSGDVDETIKSLTKMREDIFGTTDSYYAEFQDLSNHLNSTSAKLPVHLYESKVLFHPAMIRNWKDTSMEFLLTAMVNGIELPAWVIWSVLKGNIKFGDKCILHKYFKVKVDSQKIGAIVEIHFYVTNEELKPFKWLEFFDDLSKCINEFADPKNTFFGKTITCLLKSDKELSQRKFMELLKYRNSKVARYFWRFLEEIVKDKKCLIYNILPRIQLNNIPSRLIE